MVCCISKLKTVFHALFGIYGFILLMACSEVAKLGLSASEQAAIAEFAGVNSLQTTPDGKYAVMWDFPSGASDASTLNFEIYMDKWSSLPQGVTAEAAGLGSGTGGIVGAKIAHLSDDISPVGKGVLLATVKGARSYTLTTPMQPNLIYAFQVRLLKTAGSTDRNDLVLIYTPSSGALNFGGVSNLALTTDGKLLLGWDAPQVSGGLDAASLSYDIYMSVTTEAPDAVIATGTVAISKPNLALASAALTGDTSKVGSLVDLSDDKLPSRNGAPIGQVKGGVLYQVNQELSTNLTYLFQVQAIGPAGQSGASKRVIVYKPSKFNFEGLKLSGVKLSSDQSTFNLSWSPPSGATGNVSYVIYGDANFTNVIGTTAETSYAIPSVKRGQSYIFAVRAKDSNGYDSNSQFVQVSVPSLNFQGLQQSDTVLATDRTSIKLSWAAATNVQGTATYTVYGDSNFTTVIGTTGTTSYTVTDIVPGQTYTFGVRVKDSAGSETNQSYAVINVPVQAFNGCTSSVALTNKTSVLVNFDFPSGAKSVSIFRGNTNIYTALAPGANAYTDTGLSPGTTYTYLCVASFNGKTVNGATTTVTTLGNSTPPAFTGLSSATAMTNSKISLAWTASPSTDLQQYNIYLASNLSSRLGTTTGNTFVVTGLNSGATFAFVVRAMNTSGYEDTNTIQKSATTLSYSVPDFAGLNSVTAASGVAGLSSLVLNWTPAGGNVTGYRIYVSTTPGGQNFTAPYTSVTGATTAGAAYTAAGSYVAGQYVTGATITGLSADTTYYLVVRAFYYDGTNVLSDVNQLEVTGKSNSIIAPTFAGAVSAAQGSGLLALSTATVTWNAPQSNGVWDGFQVAYEAGTCAAGFTAPTAVIASGASTTSYTVTGLTANTTYRFRVRSNYAATSLQDTNTACVQASTTATPPVFNGVASVSIAGGIAGFSQLSVTWPQATGSFSNYLVEYATTSNFSAPTTAATISTVGTTSTTITGLSANTQYYVRVTAAFTGVTPNLTAGGTSVLSATTTPTVPTGEGVTSVNIASATSLTLTWTAPTNSGLYSGYKMWRACSATAANDITTAVAGAATQTFSSGTLTFTDSGRTSGTPCCYQVRAYYSDGTNSLASQSNVAAQCATPQTVAPTFSGVQSVSTPASSAGFSQLNVTWSAIAAGESGNFSYYEVYVSSSQAAPTTDGSTGAWSSGALTNVQITNAATTSTTLTGLSSGVTYYVRVRAVNATGSPAVGNGGSNFLSATTTPPSPTGDNLSAASSVGPSSISLTYTPPSATASIGGVFNNVFLFVYQGTSSQVSTYQSGLGGGTITNAHVTATISGATATLGSAPTSGALIKIPATEYTAGTVATYTIDGLTTGQQVCVLAMAVYWVNGQPTQYMISQTPTTKCATPTVSAPTFAGVTSLAGYDDNRDFTQIIVGWGTITGTCTGIDISVATTSGTPDFTTATFPAAKNLTCTSASTAVVSGLTAGTTYYIQVRAKNTSGGTTLTSGTGTELFKITRPTTPTGDGATAVTFNSVAKAIDTASLTWSLPSTGYWNKIAVWRATGANTTVAAAAVRMSAITYAGSSGSQTYAPLYTVNKATPASSTATTYTDPAVTDGTAYCYLVRAIYDDGTNYNASTNQTTQCGSSTYSAVSFAGVAPSGATVSTTWSSGTAKITLPFASAAAGDVEEFWVYYSPSATLSDFDLTSAPWQIVDNTATSVHNPGYPATTSIFVGGLGRTFSGTGYFIVRAVHYGISNADTNTAVSSAVTITAAQSNYVYVAPSLSRLGYPYWIGTYEASLASGSLGSDTVTATETSLVSCSHEFHTNYVARHSSCGTFASTGVATSQPSVTPVSATWHQAWTACRNASTGTIGATGATTTAGNIFVRLPTETEWRRASRWAPNNYANQWTVYSGGTGNCNTASGAVANTGAGSNCVSLVGAYDMAGNRSEWIDQRLTMYDINAASESRFSYGPQIGRVLANGIDTQASAANTPVTRRYHNITPGANDLALLLGSDAATTGYTYQKQYDAETESWQDPTLSTATGTSMRGFRCVAFPNKKYVPTMAKLAQPSEPVFTASDIPGSPTPTAAQAADWKIPENLYVKDARPESVRHLLQLFPNTTNLAVWPLNNSSGGTQTDITGNGRDLTASSTLGNGVGLDGKTYTNDFSGSKTLTSSDALFNQTGAFTMGGWFYVPVWSGQFGLMGGPGYHLFSSSNTLAHGTSVNNSNSSAISPGVGWHHIVFSRASGGAFSYYLDGAVLFSGSLAIGTTTGQFSLGYGCSVSGSCWYFAGRIANAFFHAGITYSTTQVQRLYYGSMISESPYHTASNLSTDGVVISWMPWSKQSCAPSCSAANDTAFEYDIYRYVEPTRTDTRTRIPWALMHGPYASLPSGVSGVNATAMPLDPLATDSSGNALCSVSNATTPMCVKVATILGSSCSSSTPSGCTFVDKTSLNNGFSSTALYNYIMVVKDGDGNARVPLVQRYRTPYLAGDFSSTATATFRTEQRWRRAAPFLVDEAFQQNTPLQTNNQIMSYVPMDVSGLDHDFFIYKYEGNLFSGSFTAGSPQASADYPKQADGSGVWVNSAAQCYDKLGRTGNFDLTNCGDGSAINASTALVQSKQGTTSSGTEQGAAWMACARTGITDGAGNAYFARLVTDSEWYKAAAWGDVAQTGTVSQSFFFPTIGSSAATLEFQSALTFTGTTTNGNATITGVTSTAGLVVGQLISGTGIPGVTTISSFVTNTSVTMSQNATASGAITVTYRPDGGCNTDYNSFGSASYFPSASLRTNLCRSRYGVADMVGNIMEATNGQIKDSIGYDNGLDGLWLGMTMISSWSTSLYNLLRGFPVNSNGSTISKNADSYVGPSAGTRIVVRGGYSANSGTTGRNLIRLDQPLTAGTGVRCVR